MSALDPTPAAQTAWRAMVHAAFRHGAEAEAEYRAERAAAAPRITDAQRAADDAADREAEAEWQRCRSDNEVMGSDE